MEGKLDSQANIYRNVFIFRSFLFFFYKSICERASFDTALPRILSRSLEMDGTVLKSMIRSLFSSRSPFIVSLLNSAFYNRRLTISPPPPNRRPSLLLPRRLPILRHTHTLTQTAAAHIYRVDLRYWSAVAASSQRKSLDRLLTSTIRLSYYSLFSSLSLALVPWRFLDISIEFIHLPISWMM